MTTKKPETRRQLRYQRDYLRAFVADIARYNDHGNDSQEDTETLLGWMAEARQLLPNVTEGPERCRRCRVEDTSGPDGKLCAECSQGEAEKAGEDR